MNSFLIYLLALRLIHIVSGVCWVGGAVVFNLFIAPSVKATNPGSQSFMQHLMLRRHYPIYMAVSSVLTILAGSLLYWHTSGGLNFNWITSGPGLILSLGAVLGLIALSLGLFIIAPTAKRLMALGQTIQATGGPPLPEQMSELHFLEARLSQVGKSEFVLMLGSLLTMAMARYWLF